jgi:hypothetical protein
MRKRLRIILIFPVVAFLFILGWILNVIGDRQKNTTAPKRKTKQNAPEEEPTANVDNLEMGLITEEKTEEQKH